MGRATRPGRHAGDVLLEPMRDEAAFDDPELDFRGLLSDHDKRPLSLQATEDALPEAVKAQLSITRQYDIDSVIMELFSPGAYGYCDFLLSFLPPHQTSISQNAHVELGDGQALHKTKNLYLGAFDFDRTNSVHIVFQDKLETDLSTNYPSFDVQRAFVDECLLPAVRHACPPLLRQHIPTCFDAARARASTSKTKLHRQAGRGPDAPPAAAPRGPRGHLLGRAAAALRRIAAPGLPPCEADPPGARVKRPDSGAYA